MDLHTNINLDIKAPAIWSNVLPFAVKFNLTWSAQAIWVFFLSLINYLSYTKAPWFQTQSPIVLMSRAATITSALEYSSLTFVWIKAVVGHIILSRNPLDIGDQIIKEKMLLDTIINFTFCHFADDCGYIYWEVLNQIGFALLFK